jgi:hypothetical protein
MSIDYLEDLQDAVDRGVEYFACPGVNVNEWYISESIEELKPRAKRTANARRFEANIYRLVNKMDTVTGDSFLVCRKILDPGPRGEPNLKWSLVDTREAADMLRDVSSGPSPYFGACIETTCQPNQDV